MKRTFALAAMTVVMFAAVVFGQDPGVADTVRLGSTTSTTIYQVASVPVYLFNDEAVSTITIPLLVDGFSGWATFDSVSFVGSRLADPTTLDLRQALAIATDTFTTTELLIQFEIGSGTSLPPGTGELCELWFSPQFGGTVAIDTLTSAINGSLTIMDASANQFSPRFQSGQMTIACDYIVGDANGNGYLGGIDFLRIHKCLLGHFWAESGPLPCFDLNCDRRTDLRDVNRYMMYMFSLAPICTCGTFAQGYYYDPGVRDTLSFESQTLHVGVEKYVDFSLFNDEVIQGFSFAWQGDGTARLQPPQGQSHHPASSRINPQFDQSLQDYEGYAGGINEFAVSSWTMAIDTLIMPGTGPIFSIRFLPLTAGTLTFRLVNYEPPGNGGSMMTGMDNNAIVPVFVSGTITVLPRPCGDADKNGLVTISDAVYLINYIFSGGPAPNPLLSGDADCNGIVTISDPVYLINFIFSGGPAPCAACP